MHSAGMLPDPGRGVYESGRLISLDRCAGHLGTHIAVQNMQSDHRDSPIAFALHYPVTMTVQAPFVTFRTDRTSTASLKIQSLFSLKVGDSCTPFVATAGEAGALISGICSTPTAMLKEGTVAVFVNDRIVVNERLCKELDKLYYDAAKIRGYFCYASITVPRSDLDVNVHPDKTEVLFTSERVVFSAMFEAVTSCLRAHSAVPRHLGAQIARDQSACTSLDAVAVLREHLYVGSVAPQHCVVSHPVSIDLPKLYIIDVLALRRQYVAARLEVGRDLEPVSLALTLSVEEQRQLNTHKKMLARLGVSWSYTGDLVLPAVFAHHAPSDHAVRTWVNALGRGGDLFAETVTLFASWAEAQGDSVGDLLSRVASLLQTPQRCDWRHCVRFLADTSPLLKHFERC